MKIIQITDLHIGQEGEDTNGVDVRKNFTTLLDIIANEGADLIVVSGDLCYNEGEAEIYYWIKSKLDALEIPVDYIAGNHDDSALLAACLDRQADLKGNELYYHKKIAQRHCLFLDSGKGILSDQQYNWIENQLATINKEVVLFMHHPPLKSGVPFMDKHYPLQDMERLQKVFFAYPHSISIFCGHYHVDKIIRYQNLTLHITPSTYFQIDQKSEEFKVDHHHIGYRVIDLTDSTINSEVHYLLGHKLDEVLVK